MANAKALLIDSFEEARRNILRYQDELRSSPELQARVRKVRSWYVERDPEGNWLFAPSKFIGYRSLSAAQYLKESGSSGARDGKETEHVLKQWYERVEDRNTRIGRELFAALREFLATIDRAPNKVARINRPKGGWETQRRTVAEAPADHANLLARISVDPGICGGRPCIRGTRMRVVDVVEAIAGGATSEQILQDFDYLTRDDIAAALLYAARAADHRVIRTA